MPNRLTKTTVALLLAALAVLVTGGITMRAFIRDVDPECPGTLRLDEDGRASTFDRPKIPLQLVEAKQKDVTPAQGSRFRIVYEIIAQSASSGVPAVYKSVRLEWLRESSDAPCVCGSVYLNLIFSEPNDIELTLDPETHTYVLLGVRDRPLTFTIEPAPSHHLQTARIVSRRHLSLAVSFAAFLALGVAWLRQRSARAYALTMHAWLEEELLAEQTIRSKTGEMLGTLRTAWHRGWPSGGRVLVAPEALSGRGVYRDIPAIEPRHIARGGHEEWARATMIRLRDARALAILSVLTCGAALAAHLLA